MPALAEAEALEQRILYRLVKTCGAASPRCCWYSYMYIGMYLYVLVHAGRYWPPLTETGILHQHNWGVLLFANAERKQPWSCCLVRALGLSNTMGRYAWLAMVLWNSFRGWLMRSPSQTKLRHKAGGNKDKFSACKTRHPATRQGQYFTSYYMVG